MYTQEFIAQVKRLYPDSPKIHELADQGQHFLGRYLNDSSHGGISPETILSIHDIKVLHAKAKQLLDKKSLYMEWYNQVKK